MDLLLRRRAVLATLGLAGSMLAVPSGLSAQDRPILGSGTVFVALRMRLWLRQAQRMLDIPIDYEGIGAGAGMNKLLAGEAEFSTSDLPLSDDQLAEAGLIQIPLGYGGLVPVVNVPGIGADELVLDGPVMAGIYAGAIKKWNDPKIAAINGAVKLPDVDIRPIHLGAPTGAIYTVTYHFTQFLLATNPEWRAKYGPAITKRWAVGSSTPTLEAMKETMSILPGGIGFMPAGRAKAEKMASVKLKNAAGKTVSASTASVAATVTQASDGGKKPVTLASLLNPPGDEIWPIVVPSYVTLPKTPKDEARGKTLRKFLRNVVEKGEGVSERSDCVHVLPVEQAAALKLLEQA